MTSRFEIVDKEYIEELKDKREKKHGCLLATSGCPIWLVRLQMFVIGQVKSKSLNLK